MVLKDKVVIVTGAGSGIGLATARRFISEGAWVIFADIKEIGKDEKKIANGNKAHFCHMNVSKPHEVVALFNKVQNDFGRLDILINNAGVELAKKVTETSLKEWNHVMDVNLKGVFLCSKAAIPIMRRQGRGVIVNVASGLGLKGGADMAAYCASKGGVIQLTKAMALDHAVDNIRVNCVCPGPVDTPLLRRIIACSGSPQEEKQRIESSIPLKRVAAPEEIANVILFLASAGSSFMTGSVVTVDGGWLAR